MNDTAVSLTRSAHSWLPATTSDGSIRPLCNKHAPRLLTHIKEGTTLKTIYQCLFCGACYDVVEVMAP